MSDEQQPPDLPLIEVSKMLEQVIVSPNELLSVGDVKWSDYCGNCDYEFRGWKFTVFNDCDEFDYLDKAESPDGRTGEFSAWWDSGQVLRRILTDKQHDQLRDACEAADCRPEPTEPTE